MQGRTCLSIVLAAGEGTRMHSALPKVLRDFPELKDVHRITLWESFKCVKLCLWDENRRRLVPLAEAAV